MEFEWEDELTPVESFVQDVKALEITNDDELENADKLGKVANKLIKEIKDKWKQPKEEAQKKHKEIVVLEKEELKPINDAKDIIKKAVAKYQNQRLLEQKQKEEQNTEDNVNCPLMANMEESKEVKSSMVKLKWKAEVVDVDKLPRKYMIPNMEMLNAMAMYKKEEAQVDGVRFFCEY